MSNKDIYYFLWQIDKNLLLKEYLDLHTYNLVIL